MTIYAEDIKPGQTYAATRPGRYLQFKVDPTFSVTKRGEYLMDGYAEEPTYYRLTITRVDGNRYDYSREAAHPQTGIRTNARQNAVLGTLLDEINAGHLYLMTMPPSGMTAHAEL